MLSSWITKTESRYRTVSTIMLTSSSSKSTFNNNKIHLVHMMSQNTLRKTYDKLITVSILINFVISNDPGRLPLINMSELKTTKKL